jgi:hypothetical protein
MLWVIALYSCDLGSPQATIYSLLHYRLPLGYYNLQQYINTKGNDESKNNFLTGNNVKVGYFLHVVNFNY